MILPTTMDNHRVLSERQLSHNCAHVCAGLHKVTCISTYSGWCSSWAQVNCDPYCRRHLEQEEEEGTTTMVILDDAFYAKNSNRHLLTNTWYDFTEDQCNDAKAKLYKSALSALEEVASECANLILAQASLQCLAFLDGGAEEEKEGY
jgi:hypothetical protein